MAFASEPVSRIARTLVASIVGPAVVQRATVQRATVQRATVRSASAFLSLSLAACVLCIWCDAVVAQLPPPGPQEVFLGDSKAQKDANQAQAQKSLRPAEEPLATLDFQAEKIEVRKESNELIGSGGLIMSQKGVQVQADSGKVNTQTKDGEVTGNVVMSTGEGIIRAESGKMNLDNETADFAKADFSIEPGGYNVQAGRALKLTEFEFELNDSSMTTCQCDDGAKPWEISSRRCHITQEGYAHTYDSTVFFEGLPVFYAPWMAFPVKAERASGLLAPTWGGTSQDGFRWRQPLFLVVDDSTDVMLTPFLDTRSRAGTSVGFRTKFSATSDIDTRLYYSNESKRGSDLRGINTTGMTDTTIDTNRFGGFYKHNWTPDPELDLPLQFVADGHYTSDNLFVREIQDPEIGPFNSNFLTSTAVFRGVAFEEVNAEVRTEYTQLLTGPTLQEQQPQRIPEFSVSNSQTFRPLGFNPYGLKLVTSLNAQATNFDRDIGGAGWRYIVKPRAQVPFRFSNVLRGQFLAELNQVNYQLSNTFLGDGVPELESSNSMTVPVFGFGTRSGVERVYDLDDNSWLANVVGLGADNNGLRLTRIKHTVEPFVNYNYVPDVDQSTLPNFDPNDRNRYRGVATYGATTRLMGRMLRPYERSRDVGELAASTETLPMFDLSGSMIQFGSNALLAPARNVNVREGEMRELASLSVFQSYDHVEADKNLQPGVDALTDVAVAMTLSPSPYFSTGIQSNYSTDEGDFSSFAALLGVRDDRENALRFRYNFIDNADPLQVVDQLEANFETRLTERFRFGYYARYDLNQKQMFESRGLIRFINACKCWSVDLGIGSQLNPDNRQLLLTFTFAGLGDITQSIGLAPQNNQVQQ